MKAKYIFWLVFLAGTVKLNAQTSKDYAVLLQAVVSESPASIKLQWVNDTAGKGYKVYRKTKEAKEWGTPVATLPNSTLQYIDNAVTIGTGYEYYVRRSYDTLTADSNRFAHGYIYAGAKLPIIPGKGKLLLLVDGNYEQPLAAEIAQLKLDLIKDGWLVKPIVVQRNMTVAAVKAMIALEATAAIDPATAVYLLGRVPVPYSGNFIAAQGQIYPPDGHPDHGGAWPADLYYGILNGSMWTDNLVNDLSPARTENQNIPGDGKFDQPYIFPDTVALQMGRVDLTNMPTFGLSDTLLVKQYLDKAHQFKTGQTAVIMRGLVDDKFGPAGGEAFAASGWRNFATMFGDSVFARPYVASTKQGNYMFTYGCGAGTYTSASGVCLTDNFKSDSISQIFTMLFGSYFGDWDSQNNLLRAPLCSKNGGLASMWSGRPHWHHHHMALGENIGYSARLTQNNYSEFDNGNSFGYVYSSSPTFVHIALMGDPSLRLHMNTPVPSMAATTSTDSLTVNISWPLQPGADGYAVFKASSIDGKFRLVKEAGSSETGYTDLTPYLGYTTYMVRSFKLEQTPSGSYYNMSLGVIDSAYSKNTTGINEYKNKTLDVLLFPNPATGTFTVTGKDLQHAAIELYDITGKLLLTKNAEASDETIDITGYTKGFYFVRIKTEHGESTKKLLIQ
jgi:hypothetical protein